MGSRIQSHQLSNGLYVSGLPETQPKERPPTVASRAVPYIGGDVKKSGELGKMFDIPVSSDPPTLPAKPSRPSSSSLHNSGGAPARSGSSSGQLGGRNSNSGQLSGRHTNSGSMNKKSSGPMSIPPTGLITSGNLSGERVVRRSGQLEQTGSVGKAVYGSAVTSLSGEVKFRCKLPKVAMWLIIAVLAIFLLVGVFLIVALKKPIILAVCVPPLVPFAAVFLWNYAWGRKGMLGFVNRYPDAELRGAIDGHYVKITGVVTCGSIPLESSYQRVSRCVYVSTELHEYRGYWGKPVNPKHRAHSWGQRHSEKYVADFYISDFQSGLRALVKAGYGAKVSVFVEPSTVVDVTKANKELSPDFIRWLADRNLSSDDRVTRLKEGYIKEGSTVSVMGVVRRHENVLMIVPPTEPVSTGCQWPRCLIPRGIESLILKCDDNQNADVVPV